MRKPVVLLVLCAATGVATSPSLAAAPKATALTVTDATGDATGLNDQGGILPASPPNVDAANQKSADIVSFSLSRQGDKTFVGTLTLLKAPSTATDYRIKMSTPDCETYFLEYESAPGLSPQGEVRETCGDTATDTQAKFDPVNAFISGNSIVWSIPFSSFPGSVKKGTVFTVEGAESSVETAAIFPALDEAPAPDGATYKVGQ